MRKNKKTLLFTTAVALFGVFVAAISTAAWFQIDSQPISTSMVTGSSSLTIDNVDGIKKEEIIDPATGLPSVSSNLTRKSSIDEDVVSTNIDKGTIDTNFDVPSEGIGYYLIKKNPGGTFKYTYNSQSYATKFETEYDDSNIIAIASLTTNASSVFRLKHYTFRDSKTVNVQESISSIYPTTSGYSLDATTKDVTVPAGTYRIWYNTSTKAIGFEDNTNSLDVLNTSEAVSRSAPKEVRGDTTTRGKLNTKSTTENVNNITINLQDQTNGYGDGDYSFTKIYDPIIHIWNISLHDDFAYSDLKAAHDAGVNLGQQGGTTPTFESNNTIANIRLCWVSNDGNNKNWKWDVPWFITNFKYNYCNTRSTKNWASTNNEGLSGVGITHTDYVYASGQTSCSVSYTESSGSTISTNKYTVTFDSGDGSSVSPKYAYQYGKISAPSAPTLANHVFNGWNLTSPTGSSYTFGSPITSDFTLYANWSEIYHVTYNKNSASATGSVPTDSNDYAYNAEVTVKGNTGSLALSNHRFGGWNKKADGSGSHYVSGDTFNITEQTTLYAEWIRRYTLTYNPNGADTGSAPSADTRDVGAVITVEGNSGSLDKANVVFDGWSLYPNGTGTVYGPGHTTTYTLNGDTNLYARWVTALTVTYDGNGSTGGTVPSDTAKYKSGDTITVKAGTPTKTGYRFDGWQISGSGTVYSSGSSFSISANTTLVAKWTQVFTVTYYANNATSGTVPTDSNLYVDNALVTIKSNSGSLTRDGYKFVGWNTRADGNGVDYSASGSANFRIHADLILYAKWDDISPSGTTYRVKVFDPNNYLGGSAYIYAWDDPNDVDPDKLNGYDRPRTSMSSGTDSVSGRTIYYFDLSISYSNFIISNNAYWNHKQTDNLSKTLALQNNANGNYYVITGDGVENGAHYTGSWYKDLAKTDTYRYYYFDNTGKWPNPYVYSWKDSARDSGGDIATDGVYELFYSENQAWGGQAMDKPATDVTLTINGKTATIDKTYIWYKDISASYDKIIFTGGGTSTAADNQTVDEECGAEYNNYLFKITGTVDSGPDAGKQDGNWYNVIYNVSFKASYFIKGRDDTTRKSTLSSQSLGENGFSFGLDDYVAPTSGYNSSKQVKDTSNAILYNFERANSNWYTDEACTLTYSATTIEEDLTLYAKYVVDLDNYTTIYVDDTTPGWGDSLYVLDSGGTECYFQAKKNMTNIYKFTAPNNWMVRFRNTSATGATSGNTWTLTYNLTSVADKTFVYIGNDGGNNRPVTARTVASVATYGTAKIQKYNTSTSSWDDIATMETGDGSSNNYFIYEHGARIAVGSRIRVYITGSSVTGLNGSYEYEKYQHDAALETVNNKLPFYLQKDGTTIKTARYTSNARFNFYITGAKTLSIAMVPDLGNGYYIMKCDNSLKLDNGDYDTNSFLGGLKMTSNSNYSADYNGFYATSGDKIFIKSYIDAVDTPYTTAGRMSGATMTSGIITFTSSGYFDISVVNGAVNVTSYEPSSFFCLNKVDISNVDTSSHIAAQSTGLVLEVTFECDNPYDTTISLDINNALKDYVGVALYVTDTQLTDSEAYTLLTTYRGQLSNNANVADQNNFTISANSGSTKYYAYIIIDYIPSAVDADYSDFLAAYNASRNLLFYLKSTQPAD